MEATYFLLGGATVAAFWLFVYRRFQAPATKARPVGVTTTLEPSFNDSEAVWEWALTHTYPIPGNLYIPPRPPERYTTRDKALAMRWAKRYSLPLHALPDQEDQG